MLRTWLFCLLWSCDGMWGKQMCQGSKHPIFPRGIVHNVGAYAVAGLGGLENEAQRNVKPDQLRTVHQPKYLKETNLRIYTTPRY